VLAAFRRGDGASRRKAPNWRDNQLTNATDEGLPSPEGGSLEKPSPHRMPPRTEPHPTAGVLDLSVLFCSVQRSPSLRIAASASSLSKCWSARLIACYMAQRAMFGVEHWTEMLEEDQHAVIRDRCPSVLRTAMATSRIGLTRNLSAPRPAIACLARSSPLNGRDERNCDASTKAGPCQRGAQDSSDLTFAINS
jgi:hypothetical protein